LAVVGLSAAALCTPQSRESAATEVVEDYRNAIADSAGAEACELLSAEGQAEVEATARPGSPAACATLTTAFADISDETRAGLRDTEVMETSVSGSTATVRLEAAEGSRAPPSTYRLTEFADGWRIADQGLPSHEELVRRVLGPAPEECVDLWNDAPVNVARSVLLSQIQEVDPESLYLWVQLDDSGETCSVIADAGADGTSYLFTASANPPSDPRISTYTATPVPSGGSNQPPIGRNATLEPDGSLDPSF